MLRRYPRTFKDSDRQREFDVNDFTTFEFLRPEELEELRGLANEIDMEEASHLHITAVSPNREYRDYISREIRRICAPAVDRVFVDHKVDFRMYGSSFLVKPPHDPYSTLPPHTDPTMVDETGFVSCTVWCPLSDAAPANGGMHVIPGSRWVVPLERGQSLPWPLEAGTEEELTSHSVPVVLKAGEAAAWDARTIHWSSPNTSAEPRIAASIAVVPKAAPAVHFAVNAEGIVHRYEVDESFAGATPLDAPLTPGVPIPGDPPRVRTADVIRAYGFGGSRPRRIARSARRRLLALKRASLGS